MTETTEYTDDDMAAVGRATMAAIKAHANIGWSPADCPSEIIGDLRNERDEFAAENEQLRSALTRMDRMHAMMMAKANHGASFYDAECIHEMNAAPIQAARALGPSVGANRRGTG